VEPEHGFFGFLFCRCRLCGGNRADWRHRPASPVVGAERWFRRRRVGPEQSPVDDCARDFQARRERFASRIPWTAREDRNPAPVEVDVNGSASTVVIVGLPFFGFRISDFGFSPSHPCVKSWAMMFSIGGFRNRQGSRDWAGMKGYGRWFSVQEFAADDEAGGGGLRGIGFRRRG